MIDLSGHWVCQRPEYDELPPIEIAPGDGIFVDVPGGADPAGGEFAIYRSNSFDNGDDVVSYVQWGTGGGRSSVAEAGGAWTGPPVEPGPTGVFLVGEPGSAAGWE